MALAPQTPHQLTVHTKGRHHVSQPLITPEELDDIREQHQEILNRNSDADPKSDVLAALALVERLLTDAGNWSEQWVEECVFFGGPDPDNCAKAVMDIPDLLDVRDLHDHTPQAGLARREVRAYAWEVIEEPGSEED